jgi:cytosine/adenosine deaminase-related metal-dependent hydrolase
MTALVNAHTHLYSGLAPLGMPAPERAPTSFLEILEKVWWRLDRALDEDSLRSSAELYVAEALQRDTAALIDHHESPGFIEGSLDVIAEVCQNLGMPAVLSYGATERNGGREEAVRGLEECRRFLTSNERPLIRGVVGLHACFTVSDETIREAADLAREQNTVLHLHVAEDLVDVEDAKQRGFDGVIDRLEKLGALIEGSILAHGVYLSEDEVRRCAERQCWLVQNPRSNRGNGVGYPAFLSTSALVALGTDGYPSDLLAEDASLVEEATAAGDDLGRAGRRLAAGAELARKWFGGSLRDVDTEARASARSRLPAIRKVAQEQADLLWKRLAAI